MPFRIRSHPSRARGATGPALGRVSKGGRRAQFVRAMAEHRGFGVETHRQSACEFKASLVVSPPMPLVCTYLKGSSSSKALKHILSTKVKLQQRRARRHRRRLAFSPLRPHQPTISNADVVARYLFPRQQLEESNPQDASTNSEGDGSGVGFAPALAASELAHCLGFGDDVLELPAHLLPRMELPPNSPCLQPVTPVRDSAPLPPASPDVM